MEEQNKSQLETFHNEMTELKKIINKVKLFKKKNTTPEWSQESLNTTDKKEKKLKIIKK